MATKTFWKLCTEDEVNVFTTKEFADEAADEHGDPDAYIIDFQGEETEHNSVYDFENDATYTLVM